jgi:hypothetical protein
VVADQRFDVGDQSGVVAQCEVGVEAVLEAPYSQLLEPADVGREGILETKVSQRLAPPQG